MFLEWDRGPALSYVTFLLVWYVLYQQLRGPQGSPNDESSRVCASRRPRAFDLLFLAFFGCLTLYLRSRLQRTVIFDEEPFFGGAWALVGYMACATAFGFLVAYGANQGHALLDDAWFHGNNPLERMQIISMVTTIVLLLWAVADIVLALRDPSGSRHKTRLGKEIFAPRLLVLLVWLLFPALSYSNAYLFTSNNLTFVLRGSFFAMTAALFFVRPTMLSFMGTAVALGLLLYEVCRYGIQASWGIRGVSSRGELCPHGLAVYLEPAIVLDGQNVATRTEQDTEMIRRIQDTIKRDKGSRGIQENIKYDATLLGYMS